MVAQMGDRLPEGFYFISLAAFMFGLTSLVTQPIFTLYILELGASMIGVGLILSIQSLLMIVFRIPLTLLAQRIGEARMLYVAFVVQAATQVLYAISPGPIWLYFIPLFQIIATGSFFQLATTMSSNMAPSDRQGDALGRFMTFMSMAMFVGPLICGALVAHISYRQLFLISAVFSIIGVILFNRCMALRGKRPPVELMHPIQRIRASSSIWAVLRERNLFLLSIIKTTYSMSNSIFITLFAIYVVHQLDFSPSIAAILFSSMGLANTLIKFPVGRISDRLDRKKVLLFTFGAIISVYIALSYVRGIALVGALIMIFGACWGTRAITEWSFIASNVSQEIKTLAISFQEIFWDIGASTGSVLAGVFAEALPFSTIFIIAALINAPAIPSIYLMEPTDQKNESGIGRRR